MRYAVYHNATCELLGTIDARACAPERIGMRLEDNRRFRLRMMLVGFAHVGSADVPEQDTFTQIEFSPLSLHRITDSVQRTTWLLFTDAHPRDLERLADYRALSK